MPKEFRQTTWDAAVEDDCRQLVRLAVREDLDREHDWTTVGLVPLEEKGTAAIVVRQPGVVAGLVAIPVVLDELQVSLQWTANRQDGEAVAAQAELGTLQGLVRDLLFAERLLLNLLGRLSGIATSTRRYVEQTSGTKARIYDTRKTTAGCRRLEKYAVRCGGGCNHRTGLYDAVLIKDNHLAFGRSAADHARFSPAEAVTAARQFLEATLPAEQAEQMIIEVEVDTLLQLEEVLKAQPDIILLDNMSASQLAEAVRRRDDACGQVQLEASGGIDLENVRAVAQSGVDRISVGALTHSAPWLDIGLDWND